MDATLLANNSQYCWMLHIASVCTPCCMLLGVVAQSLIPVKLFHPVQMDVALLANSCCTGLEIKKILHRNLRVIPKI